MARLNPRTFRSGRVLFDSHNPNNWMLLLSSTGPGIWYAAQKNSGGVRIVAGMRSDSLAAAYDSMRYGIMYHRANINPREASAIVGLIDGATAVPSTDVNVRRQRGFLEKIAGGSSLPVPPEPKSTAAPADGGGRSTRATFEVPKFNEDPYWYESPEDEALYTDFIALREAMHTVNLLITGPSGAGKTRGIQRLGEKLGIPVHIVNCQAITTPEKWLGQMHADVTEGTRFEPSQHIQWVERTHPDCEGHDRCILLYDEITRLRPELNNMTYSLFDTQRGLEVPQMNRRVMMSDANIIIATANIGAAFAGTHTQDRAFRERFSITMERDFPPAPEEVKVLASATGIDKAVARQLVAVANDSRNMWRNEEIDSPVSTRTLLSWALLVAGGYAPRKAADYTVLPMYSDEGGASSDRAKISASIDSKVSTTASTEEAEAPESEGIPF